MRSILSYDSPIIQFLARVWDLIVLSLLFVLCLLPVVTGGAGLTALYKVTQNLVYDREDGIVKPFFRAFRENFKTVTPVWLLFLLAMASLVCDFVLIYTYDGPMLLYVLAGALLIMALGIKCYLFPLLARYENSVWNHVKNAAILAISNLPKTLCMIVLEYLPLLLLLINNLKITYWILMFWPILGFSCAAYIESALILKKTFSRLEPEQAPAE